MKSYYDSELFDRLEQFTAAQKNDLIFDFPILRIQLAFFLGKLKGNKFDPHAIFKDVHYKRLPFDFKSFIKLIKLRFQLFLLGLYNRKLLKNKALIFGFADHYSRQEDGTEFNLYLSPIKNELKQLNIEFDELLLTQGDVQVKLTRLKVFYDILLKYNHLLFAFKAKIFNRYKAYIENAELVKGFLIENEVPETAHCVTTYYNTKLQQEVAYSTFRQLLGITRPKLTWVYGYYNNNVLALCRAANACGVPVVEYQHSQQSDFHFAYARWNRMDNYYHYFPSIFWVWSKEDGDRILRNFSSPKYKPQIVPGGNIAVIQKKQLFNYKEESAATGILISLAGEWIPEFLEDTIANDNKYTWYFRLHPRYPQDKERLTAFKNKFPAKVETENANRLSIYQLFTYVNMNITNSSGAALEAEYFGVKNIIIGERGSVVYKDKIESGKFLCASNLSELSNILYSPQLTHTTFKEAVAKETESLDKAISQLFKNESLQKSY